MRHDVTHQLKKTFFHTQHETKGRFRWNLQEYQFVTTKAHNTDDLAKVTSLRKREWARAICKGKQNVQQFDIAFLEDGTQDGVRVTSENFRGNKGMPDDIDLKKENENQCGGNGGQNVQ